LHANRGIADFIVWIAPNNFVYRTSVCLEYLCTNSQAKYESVQFGLQDLIDMGVKDIDAFGNSLLVVYKWKENVDVLTDY
jgi:ribonuclease HI